MPEWEETVYIPEKTQKKGLGIRRWRSEHGPTGVYVHYSLGAE